MSQEIQTISLGGTNCYLVRTDSCHILIDTGFPFQRGKLEIELDRKGCKPGSLALMVITHGDIDHTGNCAYLREKYGARIAMHEGDTEMCMKDGMTRDRGEMPADVPLPLMVLWLTKGLLTFALGQVRWRKPFDRFEPDFLLEEGQSLAEYGFDAEILYTPGHSIGSVSVLTGEGDLICGDMFSNAWGRVIRSTDKAGLERLKEMGVGTLYPGHGSPFSMDRLITVQSPRVLPHTTAPEQDQRGSSSARSPSRSVTGNWQAKARPGNGASHTWAAACPSTNPRSWSSGTAGGCASSAPRASTWKGWRTSRTTFGKACVSAESGSPSIVISRGFERAHARAWSHWP